MPFGVDTEKFTPLKNINEKNKVLIYHKRRDPSELQYILNFFQNKNIEVKIFDYVNKYSEEEYLTYLQNAKFGIWVDAHESQGFALQEALSCNVPILVWNIKYMNQEFGSNYDNIPATTIPYWDERCGEYFYEIEELENIYDKFISKLDTYKPREFVLENLSMEVCENKLIDIIKNIK
jgi:glycosyltransferase involved in cell wall biosynthesis